MWHRLLHTIKFPALILGLSFTAYELWVAVQVAWWVTHDPHTSAFMSARLETLREQNPQARLTQRWVPYSQISPHLKRAVIAAEDGQFVEHGGFDWDALQAAMKKNWKKGRIVAGGSTISQQLAKNLFLSGKRSLWRKIQEAYITVLLELMMDKHRILEIYLNVIEWGDGVYGAEAAAQHYFGITSAELNPLQAARLAAMIPNPRYYDHHRYTAYLQYRSTVILARLPSAAVPR